MSQNTNYPIVYVGVDVAKDDLQIFLAGCAFTLPNTPKGCQRLLGRLRRHPAVHLIVEASGGFERKLLDHAHQADIPISRVEASRVRSFAEARGQRAKSDAIDAQVLAHYGEACQPERTPAPSPIQRQLSQLTRRRRQLQEILLMEQNREPDLELPALKRSAATLRTQLRRQIKAIEKAMAAALKKSAPVSQNAQRLQEVVGVGFITAATLLAEMPELGAMKRGQAAALAGVAPFERSSGKWQGKRYIGGGRAHARRVLYMAALVASQRNPILKAFYQKLLAKGKPAKVALTAVMRKLVVLLNHLLQKPNFILAS